MNNGHKTIVAMLAVVAVLLVVNIVQGPRAAEAQGVKGDGEPYVVKWLPEGNRGYYRVWSDGQVDEQSLVGGTCEPFEFFVHFPPAGHPFDVVDASYDSDGMIVEYADGRIDYLNRFTPGQGTHCTLSGDGSAPFCLGDVDRNGETNFDDLLFLLNDWGECE